MVRSQPAVQDSQIQSLGWEDPLEKEMATTPLFLPGESHGQRNLAGYSPRGLKESDTSEPLSLPLHVMILKSKLTVIIKFSLNIQEFLNDRKQDKGNHSLHYHSLCQLILFYWIFKCQWVRRKFSQRALRRAQMQFESVNRH